MAADVLCSGVYGVLTVTLVVLSRKLGAGNSGYGLLLGAYGIGGVLGATVTGRMADPAKWRSTLMVALLLVASTLVVIGSLIAGPLVSLVGLEGAFTATGMIVLIAGALLVRRPLVVAPTSA